MMKEGFISWSGNESRQIAEALREMLKFILPNPQLFVASEDLKGGDVWFSKVASKLEACDVGVIIVTPQNKMKPWLYFEAGAIAKRVGQSAAIPLLCGVPVGALNNTPLANLQALTMGREDILKLALRLNELLELGLDQGHVKTAFQTWWPQYEDKLADPKLWAGTEPEREAPTIADVSVKLDQISAGLSTLGEVVRQGMTAPAIMGQGDLATTNASQLVAGPDGRIYRLPTDPNRLMTGNALGRVRPFRNALQADDRGPD